MSSITVGLFLIALLSLDASPSYPLELNFFAPLTPSATVPRLYVGQADAAVHVSVHNVRSEPQTTVLVVEDISESGFTDSILLKNVTIDALNQTYFSLPWDIQTPGNHTLFAMALSRGNIPSIIGSAVEINAIVEPKS